MEREDMPITTPNELPIRYGAQVTMPPGAYFLGDPSYVFEGQAQWSEILQAAESNTDAFASGLLLADVDGLPVLGLNTLYGDGVFHSTFGAHSFAVDAGMIGLVPTPLVDSYSTHDRAKLETLGAFIESDEEIVCTLLGGTLRLGNVRIETGDEADEAIF